jgi:hypothetical protein
MNGPGVACIAATHGRCPSAASTRVAA